MLLHPKAKEFAKSGLFAGVKTFDQLEKRIAAIPENKGKGDAFEVFAEAYLATQRKHEIRTAWPLDGAPLSVLKKLKLPLKDYGVDGVMQTTLGGHQVYQVKFRSGRTPLTWEELSTFMGLSDCPEIQSKVVLTNCDELPAVINERHNFFCIRGSDLDRLTGQDFKAIEAWVSESVVAIKKSTPFPHQQEALDALLPALKTEDRVSAIMACGTGKTLTALWTTEQLGASKVLVLLPSLALLRQTLHEWLKETSLDSLAYLCVCSDKSVTDDADAISTAQSDLDFEVSTDSSTVRRFLDVPFKGTKVIFSTYQSAAVVGEAMKRGESFDLGIFDEAHKTAGREGRNYGYALEDKNLAIRKRLFVTATPRHYNPSKRNKEGEATVAFSMDEPKVYGPQSYVLSFGEAARRKIICGYKVIISVITSEQIEEVNDEILSKGTVAVKGNEIRARQVANQIALRDAVAQYGVSKIFTFHSTVKSAASFTNDGSEGVCTHLPDFRALHVSGAMPTARRERVMKEFRSAPRAVMSNARCLTEGVDVPAVDMVAFLSPKKSKVDIVQAIGRAMRKSGDKEVGYILIPLYLEQKAGESIETAVARANFEEVWDILQSLQEQDEVLAELIRDMAVAKGSGKGFDDSRFKDRIAFTGPVLSLEGIRQAVTTRVLERLEPSWDVNFGKLVKFKEEHGHCRVPKRKGTNDTLAAWVGSQRLLFSQNTLSAERAARLEGIAFDWDPFTTDWERMFLALVEYKSVKGDCLVSSLSKTYKQLGGWVSLQRMSFSSGTLPVERIRRLEALGFDWDPTSTNWEQQFEALIIYKKEHGDCRVPKRSHSYLELGQWVGIQRRNYSKGLLSVDRTSRLDSLGFEWDIRTSDWERMFRELSLYKDKYGDCRVPNRSKYHRKLGTWVANQRSNFSRGKVSTERIARLEALGFQWDPVSEDWESNFAALSKYKNTRDISSKDRSLWNWIQLQRRCRIEQTISSDRIARLNSLDFEWEPVASTWERRYEDLKIFQREHGHCRVPFKSKEYKKLSTWVSNVRSTKEKLTQDRIQRLNSIGFIWDLFSSELDYRIAALRAFKVTHGHCCVPYSYKADKALGRWVNGQRRKYLSGDLSPELILLLESLGFEWHISSPDWESHFQDLKLYRMKYGHCSPPVGCKEFNRVGSWASTQRSDYSSGKLSAERKARLDEIGFEWNLFSAGWERWFEVLMRYKTANGNCRVSMKQDANKPLGTWVANQRKQYRSNNLSPDRISRLEGIGFEWILR